MKVTRMLFIIFLILGAAIYVVLPNSPGLHFLGMDREFETRLGLDLIGGIQALLEADVPAEQAISSDSMETARTIVENRVNGLGGLNEAVVQQAGDRRIVVEIPGETDPEQALATIKQTGLLEFVDMSSISPEEAVTLQGTTIKTDLLTSDVTQTVGTGETVYHTIMTGKDLKNVYVTTDRLSQIQVAFELDNEGASIFGDYTANHIGQVLAIVLDKQVISAPRIDSAITGGKGVITGRFTSEEANTLAVQLRYGSLPIPLKVITSQSVGPTLGKDSLNKSLVAGVIGLSVVMIYMAIYYRLPGLVADLALICYALITFALFRFIPVTLTLPGIAGFVLSIGMAVDANILIFERLKEELREGKQLKVAVDLGWERAWPSIRDSNFSTLITCTILFWFGNAFGASIVKGFSLTLALGVLVSMFTAIIVSRTFLHAILDRINFKQHKALFGVRSQA
jgi:preprotein translocase subunit SecD